MSLHLLIDINRLISRLNPIICFRDCIVAGWRLRFNLIFFGNFLIHDFYGEQKLIENHWIFISIFHIILKFTVDRSVTRSWFSLPFISSLFSPCDELNCGTKHLSCLLESVYKHRITLVYFHDDVFSFSPGFVCCMRFCCLLHETVRNIGFAYNEKRAEGKTVYLKYHACASTLRWWLSDEKIERTRENLFSLISSTRRRT